MERLRALTQDSLKLQRKEYFLKGNKLLQEAVEQDLIRTGETLTPMIDLDLAEKVDGSGFSFDETQLGGLKFSYRVMNDNGFYVGYLHILVTPNKFQDDVVFTYLNKKDFDCNNEFCDCKNDEIDLDYYEDCEYTFIDFEYIEEHIYSILAGIQEN